MKIEDEQEALRWIEEGRTYAWMVKEHAQKYGVRVTPSTFVNLRRRHGLPDRAVRNARLLPWSVAPRHRRSGTYLQQFLRVEARMRAGVEVSEDAANALAAFKARLARDGRVVHYEPLTDRGWYLVPRRKGVDLDMIREPSKPTRQRMPRE